MQLTQLILGILATFATHGPDLVKSVTDLIHGNPQQQGETDDQYVARVSAMIDAKAADTFAVDKKVEDGS